jgi:cyclophilin family peptidyl-prolyl cis-trans isomerase
MTCARIGVPAPCEGMPFRRAVVLAVLLPLACTDDKDPADATTAPLTTTVGPSGPESTSNGPGPLSTTETSIDPTSGGTTTTGSTTADPTTADPTTAAPTTAPDATTTTGGETTGVVAIPCEGDAPKVLFSTTLGDMVMQLDAVNAPITTANFIAYVDDGFFDGTIFHRVIDGFVIQGGGFTPDLQMKPTDPPIPLEISSLIHVDGAISMARTNEPDSATSQFFVCDGPQPGLDGNYAVFGVLIEGFEVLAAISAVPVGDEGPYTDVPVTDVIVNQAVCVP